MIAIPISAAELEREILAVDPAWPKAALKRFKACATAGGFKKASGEVWSRIKRVYMAAQHHKCAYCESPMPEGDDALIAYDVEHFRPKSQVTPWEGHNRQGRRRGYWWLAHAPLNYAVSCKVCNSPLKADRFPVLGKAAGAPGKALVKVGCQTVFGDAWVRAIQKLNAQEQPVLIYPLANLDEDPQRLLKFNGAVAAARSRSGTRAVRARKTIAFFKLNVERVDLMKGRARVITAMAEKLALLRTGTKAQRARRQVELEDMVADDAPFAACARDFLKLHARSPAKAREMAEAASDLLRSYAPGRRNKNGGNGAGA